MTDSTYQPTLAGLRAFAAVAEKHHFSLAAAGLGLSQSTLSQALSSLEAGLGIQLIERSTRRGFLTAEGEELLARSEERRVGREGRRRAGAASSAGDRVRHE